MFERYFREWNRIIPKEEVAKVMWVLNKEYSHKLISPEKHNVFRAFNLCPYDELKVVMVGQDPYPQKGVTTGLAFANTASQYLRGQMSPSLRVLRDALCSKVTNQYFFDVTLEKWAEQGILLLNSALTVEVNKIGSHTNMWRNFIGKLLRNLSTHNTGIVYVLWGRQAQNFKPYINKDTNYILEEFHPAYYAREDEFLSREIFDKIDQILKENNNFKIKWYEEIICY